MKWRKATSRKKTKRMKATDSSYICITYARYHSRKKKKTVFWKAQTFNFITQREKMAFCCLISNIKQKYDCSLPWRCVVHIQQRLVEIGQVKIIFCFIIFSKSFIFRGREFTEWSKISVYISYIESMRLIKISIPKKKV